MSVTVEQITSQLIEVATPGPQGPPGPAGSGSFTTPLTVSQLPTSPQGTRAFVTDSMSASFGVIASGGGTNAVPVFFNGTNWIVG